MECWECWITSHVDVGAGDVCGGFGGGDGGVAVTLARLDGAGGSRQLHGTMMFACLQSRFFVSQFLHLGLLSSHLMRRARQVALRERVRHRSLASHVTFGSPSWRRVSTVSVDLEVMVAPVLRRLPAFLILCQG